MSQQWVEKYRPASLDDFRGSSKTVEQVRDWVANWSSDQNEKALLLHGPPGSGKTSLVHALADAMDRELFETNASEARTKDAVQEKLAQAVKQRSFTGKEKIILIDEVDGMGRSDRGGKKIINRLLGETRFPIILTANDPYDSGMQSIRNKATVVELGGVHTNSIAARLREICEEEGVGYEDGAMKAIARRADGDMRSAINDLEGLARTGRVTEGDVKDLGYRETEREIFETLKIIFKTTTAQTASDAPDGLDEDHDTLFEWIRENVPKEYTTADDMAAAYDRLSRADLFKGRMMHRQEWTLLKYIYAYMTVGVALSKEEKYAGWTKYGYPSTIRRMGQSQATRAKRDSVGEKIGDELHMSVQEATDMLPVLQILFQDDGLRENIVTQLELEDDEVEFIESF
jgi:replication factor C large subunit